MQQEMLRSWSGYCESRVRRLIDTLGAWDYSADQTALPIENLRLMPKKLPLLSREGEGLSLLIGFDVVKARR